MKHKAPCYDVRYCLLLTVLAQSSSSPTLAGIGATVSTLIWTIGCFGCCWCFLKKFLRHSQPASHANRPRPQRSFPSPVIYYQNSQKGVTPSRGNTVSYIPPYASTFACRQVPINGPLALQYECSGHNAAAPPPYLSLPPPYTALQSQHSQVHTIESGAEVLTEPILHSGSDSEVPNEVESVAEVLAQPLLHAAPEVESGAEVLTEPVLHVGSDSEVQNKGAEVLAQPVLHVGSDSEVQNEVESMAEVQA